MPTPTRPTTGGPVQSSWGQEVHDQSFAPAGGLWRSQSNAIGPGLAGLQVPLLATTDPGSWLAAAGATTLTVPADGDGLYALAVLAQCQTNEAGAWRFVILQNAAMVAAANIDNAVAGAVTSWGFTAAALLQLAAGDAINLRHDAAGPSAGRVNYARIALTRIGRAWGLP